MVRKKINEFERQRKKGFYVEFEDKNAPRIKIKSTSANAPKVVILKSVWKHPDYNTLQKQKVTKLVTMKKIKRRIK